MDSFARVEERSKVMRRVLQDGDQDEFLKLLADINSKSCFHMLSNILTDLYSAPSTYYLKYFLLKIKDIGNAIEVPSWLQEHGGGFRSIQGYIANKSVYQLCDHNNLNHITLLLDYYMDKFDPFRIKLFIKILEECMCHSEPGKDRFVSTAVFNYLYADKEPDPGPMRLGKLKKFLEFYGAEIEHIWSKEHIGNIIDEAISKHQFRAVKLLISERLYIDDVVHQPLTKLLKYYYMKGPFRANTGGVPTAKLNEVVSFFLYLAGKHKHLTEKGLFFSMLQYLQFPGTVHVLECLYDKYGEEKIDDLLSGAVMSTKLKKIETGDPFYDSVLRLIKGDKEIWTDTKIGTFLRQRATR